MLFIQSFSPQKFNLFTNISFNSQVKKIIRNEKADIGKDFKF